MTAIAMDTYKIVKRLTQAGFTDSQAEVVTDILRESRDLDLSNLATKADIELVKRDIADLGVAAKADLAETKGELKADIAATNANIELVRRDIELSRRDITIRLGGMLVVITGILLAAIRYMPVPHP